MKQLLSISFILLISLAAKAQTSDEELAAQYFSNGEFDKAEILYKKLLKKDESSVYIYQNYLECLVKLKLFDEAEKMISRQMKRFPEKPLYAVDLGYLFGLAGDEKKAAEHYAGLVKNSSSDLSQINQLAMAFTKREAFQYAVETYLKARKSLNAPEMFSQNLTDLYYTTANYKGIINECLELLSFDDRGLEVVKSRLIRLVDQDIETAFLQERVALYLQKSPEKVVFDELMLWVYIQQKKFNVALRQSHAMDKRLNTEGRTLVSLAQICVSNRAYPVAIEAYEKVLAFGKEGYFYVVARGGLLETAYTSLKMGNALSGESLNALVIQYLTFIGEYGSNWNTAPTVKQLADIYIYHVHDLNKGISLLEELVAIPRLQHHVQAEYKLALGDAYLIRNEVWDAALLYGQVDKDFKEEPLGQEAKFRNARLSYFQGDFAWAKDQLDVLKTATSQLISNNAIELALTIQDNTGLDSSTAALADYAKAQLLLFQNRYNECLSELNLLPFKYPNHSLEDEIYFTKARVMEMKADYKQAEEYYLNVVNYFGGDILADNAVYHLAQLYQNVLNRPEDALKMYEKLIYNYSGSLFVVEARKQYNIMKDRVPDSPQPSP